jgi:hypothetical protein
MGGAFIESIAADYDGQSAFAVTVISHAIGRCFGDRNSSGVKNV